MRYQIQQAEEAGYSPDEIVEFLKTKKEITPQIQQAEESGYSSEEIAKYLKEKPTEKEKKVAKGFKFFGFEPSAETISKIRPKIGLGLKSIAKGTIGLPGDIWALSKSLLGLPEAHQLFPTSEQVGQLFEKYAGEQFRPKNETERILADIAETDSTLIGFGTPIKTALKAATTGKILKNIGKGFGFPEWAQTGLDITGTILGGSKFGNLKTYKSSLYNAVEKSLPSDAEISAKYLGDGLSKIKNKIEGGIKRAPGKSLVKDVLEDIENQIKDGKINVNEIWKNKKDINRMLGTRYEDIKGYQNYLKDINRYLNNSLKIYGKQNPIFYENLKKADKIFGDISQLEKTSSFLEKMKEAEKFGAAYSLITGNLSRAAQFLGLGQITELGYNLARNPKAIYYYGNVLKAGAKENKAAILKNLKKLDEELRNQSQ